MTWHRSVVTCPCDFPQGQYWCDFGGHSLVISPSYSGSDDRIPIESSGTLLENSLANYQCTIIACYTLFLMLMPDDIKSAYISIG